MFSHLNDVNIMFSSIVEWADVAWNKNILIIWLHGDEEQNTGHQT